MARLLFENRFRTEDDRRSYDHFGKLAIQDRARNLVKRKAMWTNRKLSPRDKQILCLAYRDRMTSVQIRDLFRKVDPKITKRDVEFWLEVALGRLLSRKDQAVDICCVPDCGKSHFRVGYCKSHYQAWVKYKDPTYKRLPNAPLLCTHPGCSNKHYARGYCFRHYDQLMEDDPDSIRCSEFGCEKRAVAKNRCSVHYQRWHRKRLCLAAKTT